MNGWIGRGGIAVTFGYYLQQTNWYYPVFGLRVSAPFSFRWGNQRWKFNVAFTRVITSNFSYGILPRYLVTFFPFWLLLLLDLPCLFIPAA